MLTAIKTKRAAKISSKGFYAQILWRFKYFLFFVLYNYFLEEK